MVENVITFFYLGETSTTACTPQMLDNLSTRSREIIIANTKQLVSLNLRILKSLYPRADFDTVGEGFVTTCSDDEGLKLVEDSAVTAEHIVDMLQVDISIG
jgi:hypothetical protein